MKQLFLSKCMLMMILSMFSTFLLIFSNDSFIIQFDNMFSELEACISMLIDKQSLMFISTVSTVSSIVLMYSFFYLEAESTRLLKKFVLTMSIFIYSMIILSMSSNMFWMMIGWDGLGISSFCLIIFYQNWKSFSSGMVTFLSNRLGDTLIIMCIVWTWMNKSTQSWTVSTSIILSLVLSMGAFSKSAQLPYLFWLPQAMAAPTPVSALVHSSTLVTAGIFTLCRFNPSLDFSSSIILFFISSLTVMMAGSSSILEFDLKKIIALSTLCHISLMIMFTLLGETTNSLLHLMMHAFFKSSLFMIAGFLIHSNFNSQDIRSIKVSIKELSISTPFFVCILSMMGFPFLSGYYSKETLFISSSFSLPSFLTLTMFLLNSLFSCAYSSRMAIYLFSVSNSPNRLKLFHKESFSKLTFLGSIFSSFLGGLIMTFLITEEEEMIQPFFLKITLFTFCFLGVILGILIDKMNSQNLFINNILSDFWKSNFLYKIFQKHFFFASSSSMWKLDEKGKTKFFILQTFNLISSFSISQSLFSLKEPLSLIKISHLTFTSLLFFTF